jgi:deaminated glutathione amidase
MARKLRVGVVQMRSGIEPAANRAAAAPFLREAANAGARLIVTPECTTRLDRNRDRMLGEIRAESDDPEIGAWGRLAKELGVWLVLGSTSVASGDGRACNRSIVFAPDGKIAARYNKIHLFDVHLGGKEQYRESATFAPGDKAVIVNGPMDAKIGLTICYDVRYPELYRALGSAGAEIITVPAAFTVPTGQAHWEVLLRARAIETSAFVIAAAQGGVHEDGRSTWGHSTIVGPWGEIIGALDHDEPDVLIKDIDLDDVVAAREKIPAWRGPQAFTGPNS